MITQLQLSDESDRQQFREYVASYQQKRQQRLQQNNQYHPQPQMQQQMQGSHYHSLCNFIPTTNGSEEKSGGCNCSRGRGDGGLFNTDLDFLACASPSARPLPLPSAGPRKLKKKMHPSSSQQAAGDSGHGSWTSVPSKSPEQRRHVGHHSTCTCCSALLPPPVLPRSHWQSKSMPMSSGGRSSRGHTTRSPGSPPMHFSPTSPPQPPPRWAPHPPSTNNRT